MTVFAIPPPATVPVVVAGAHDEYAVRRIYSVGGDYADHAREMGSDPDRHSPFFLSRPVDAIVSSGNLIPYPAADRRFST
jgi:fumarylpyruvate hydrolase